MKDKTDKGHDPIGYDGLAAPVKITGAVDYPPLPPGAKDKKEWSTKKVVLFVLSLFVGGVGWAAFIQWITDGFG